MGTNANRVAYSALKHTHEKVGDHWEPKEQNGPSDTQTEGGKNTNRKTAGGGGRERLQEAPAGPRASLGRLRALEHDQGRAGGCH